MIHQAMAHIAVQLNDYLNLRAPSGDEERVLSGSLFDLDGKPNATTKEKILMSLVNLEQDRVYRSVNLYEKQADGTSARVRPEVKVNLYLLFIANLTAYAEALKAIDNVIGFFQTTGAFDYKSIPALATRQGRVVFELFSMSFEQQNHLWGTLGAKYMPSVMYKAGIFDITDEQIEAEVRPVEQILVNE